MNNTTRLTDTLDSQTCQLMCNCEESDNINQLRAVVSLLYGMGFDSTAAMVEQIIRRLEKP